jgi:hypothetical protein
VAEIRVDVDPAAVEELFSSWDGPVGQAVADVTDEIEFLARLAAPVSRTGGSPLAPSGTLKLLTRIAAQHHYDDDGHVLGLVGAPRYPFNFIANPTSNKGFTHNPRSGRRPGRGSVRRADDNYLERAVEEAPEIVIGDPHG